MFAVVKSGGRQFKVVEGQELDIDLMAFANEGHLFEINEVLLLTSGNDTSFNPKASVQCEVVKHFRGPKLIVFKNRQRHTFRKKKGHRQDFTRIKINKIVSN